MSCLKSLAVIVNMCCFVFVEVRVIYIYSVQYLNGFFVLSYVLILSEFNFLLCAFNYPYMTYSTIHTK